jgi:hypothetical protein
LELGLGKLLGSFAIGDHVLEKPGLAVRNPKGVVGVSKAQRQASLIQMVRLRFATGQDKRAFFVVDLSKLGVQGGRRQDRGFRGNPQRRLSSVVRLELYMEMNVKSKDKQRCRKYNNTTTRLPG